MFNGHVLVMSRNDGNVHQHQLDGTSNGVVIDTTLTGQGMATDGVRLFVSLWNGSASILRVYDNTFSLLTTYANPSGMGALNNIFDLAYDSGSGNFRGLATTGEGGTGTGSSTVLHFSMGGAVLGTDTLPFTADGIGQLQQAPGCTPVSVPGDIAVLNLAGRDYGQSLVSSANLSTARAEFVAAGHVLTQVTDTTTLGAYDALWISAHNSGTTLTAGEIADIQAFLAAGKRVVMIGENSSWTAWNNSLLSVVSGAVTGASAASGPQTTLSSHPLVSGIAAINFPIPGIADLTVGSPTSLVSLNSAAVYGSGGGEALFIADLNWHQDGFISNDDNVAFAANIAGWMVQELNCLSLACPSDVTVECASPSGTPVTLDFDVDELNGEAVTVTIDVDGTNEQTTILSAGFTPATVSFTHTYTGLGDHTVEVTVLNTPGDTDMCSMTVTVEDTTPPVLSGCPVGSPGEIINPVAGSTVGSGTLGQSFTVGVTGTLASIGVYPYTADSATLDIFAGDGYGGTLLHSQPITTTSTGGSLEVFALTSTVPVTPGVYTFRVTPAGTWITLGGAGSDFYPGGRLINVSSWDISFRAEIAGTPGQVFECTGPMGTPVTFPTITATDLCDGPVAVTCVSIDANAGLQSGDLFPLGLTTIECRATCTWDVLVQDTTPPVITSSILRTLLWPARNGLIPIGMTASATDVCDGPVGVTVTVFSDEANGPPPYSPDALGTAPANLRLRMERAYPGNGRVYLVRVTATDASGNTASTCKSVIVPVMPVGTWILNVRAQAAAGEMACAAADPLLPLPGWFQLLQYTWPVAPQLQ